MILLDANYILRYLLQDHEEMFLIAKETIHNNGCMVLNEVVAEVVYVLQKVYSDVLLALQYYQERNIDFVDGYLCALKDEYEVKTFDKKLLKCCQ